MSPFSSFRLRLFDGYAAVLKTRGVPVPVLGIALASLSVGFLGLAVLLMIQRDAGGFAAAGTVGALLGVGTGIGIAVQGRLMDRLGHPAVLLGAVALQALALVTLVAAVRSGAPLWVCGGVAFVAGLGEPQVGGSLRALWPTLVAQEHRRTAMALSSIVFELAVVLGPLLLAATMLVAPAEVVVLAGGALFVVGAAVLAGSRAARSWTPVPDTTTGLLGPLVSARLRRVLVVTSVQGLVTGLLQVACAAFVTLRGQVALSGVLYAVLSIGSLMSTVVYGALFRSGSPRSHIAKCAGPLAVALLGAAFAPSVTILGLWVFLAGLALGPIAVSCFVEAATVAPADAKVSAFTTLTAAGLFGTAAGTAVAGVLVDASPPFVPWLAAAALTAVAMTAVLVPVAD